MFSKYEYCIRINFLMEINRSLVMLDLIQYKRICRLLCRCQGDLICVIYFYLLFYIRSIRYSHCLKTKQIPSHTYTHYDRLNGMNGSAGLSKDIVSNLLFVHCQRQPRNDEI